jgi:hypothetical protein
MKTTGPIDPVTRAPLRAPKRRKLTPAESAAVKSLVADSGYTTAAARREVLSFGPGPR